jgi:hypothetical protein
VIEQADKPYLQAVEAEFDLSRDRKKALAVVMLAQSDLHSRILDEIEAYLLHTLRDQVNVDLVANETSLYRSLKSKNTSWLVRRPTWPLNCQVGLTAYYEGFRNVFFGVKAPDPEKNTPAAACAARPRLRNLQNIVPNGRSDPNWVWWQDLVPKDWSPEFAARLVIESPTSQIEDHAWMQDFARQLVQLVQAVEDALGDSGQH